MVYGPFAGGEEIQPLLRANADGGELVRPCDGLRSSSPLHRPRTESHVAALPVPEGRDHRPVETQLRAAGREGCCRWLRHNQGRDATAQVARPEPEAAEGLPPDGHDGARGLEAAAGPARTVRQHIARMALRAFLASVSPLNKS